MGRVAEDIEYGSSWTIKAFKALGVELDYSIDSIQEIENFFNEQLKDGKPKTNSLLADNEPQKLICITSYLGDTLVKNIKYGRWNIIEDKPQATLNAQVTNGNMVAFPMQKVVNRVKNGAEDNLYIYAKAIVEKMNSDSKAKKTKRKLFGQKK